MRNLNFNSFLSIFPSSPRPPLLSPSQASEAVAEASLAAAAATTAAAADSGGGGGGGGGGVGGEGGEGGGGGGGGGGGDVGVLDTDILLNLALEKLGDIVMSSPNERDERDGGEDVSLDVTTVSLDTSPPTSRQVCRDINCVY